MNIDYCHGANLHTVSGAKAAMETLIEDLHPESLLDVGCGTGTWLKAAMDLGVQDILGIDGVAISRKDFLVPAHYFRQQNLATAWNLGRRFDVALCLEVAEHLEENCSSQLIASLTEHSDVVVFSAACPGQNGQHHVNCQWPVYWQKIFNRFGFVCCDEFRCKLWNDSRIEPWYRQNLFVARRDPSQAGSEPAIDAIISPDMLPLLSFGPQGGIIEDGTMPLQWYLRAVRKGLQSKIRRHILRRGAGRQ